MRLLEGSSSFLMIAAIDPAAMQDYGKWILIAEGVVILGLIITLILVAIKKKSGGRDGGRVHRDEYPDDFFERDFAGDDPEDADFYETGFDEPFSPDLDPEDAWDDTPKVLEPYDTKLQEVSSAAVQDRSLEEKVQSLLREQKPQEVQGGASSLTQALSYIDYGEEETGKGGASSLTQALSYIDYGEEETGKAGASSVTEVLDFIDYGEEAGKGGASSLTQALNFIDYGQDETK